MKIGINKTNCFLSFKKYPATFGYRAPDGKEKVLKEGNIIIIRIFGIEIQIDTLRKKKCQN
jgi:hypothetical protein